MEYNINSLKDLEDIPVVLPVNKSSHRKRLRELCLDKNVTFNNILSIENYEMIHEAVLQGVGVGYILKNVVQKDIDDGLLEEVKIKEELPSVTVNLVYIDKYLMPAPKEFINNYLKKN